MKLTDIALSLGMPCDKDILLSGVRIDSRQPMAGCLFVALRGARFDGHDFIIDAVAQGAVAVVCEKKMPDITVPQWVVPDTVEALALMAKQYRKTIPCKTIALTGSNGKTTVKEMIAAILPRPSYATAGNLNNHIGAPLSVLALQPTHRYAVFELGANHIGEIAQTVAVVQPDVALINNIGPAHLEGFGSIEGVARAKGEIYQGLPAGGTAIINDDDAYASSWGPLLEGKKIRRFSTKKPVDVYAKAVHLDDKACASFTLVTPLGEALIQLQAKGLHQVSNALAAASCTQALGIALSDIAEGLSSFEGVAGRMTFRKGLRQAQVIDDTYNANLQSVLAAMTVLTMQAGKRIFVLGDLGELGASTDAHHREIGRVARETGVDCLLTCGQHSQATSDAFGKDGHHYASHQALLAALIAQLDSETTVLVKGSRSARMECIVEKLIEE